MRNLIGIIVLLPTLAYAAQLINGNQVNPASDLAIHKVAVNTTDLVTDAVNHRVGIGVTPTTNLHVGGSGTQKFYVQSTADSSYGLFDRFSTAKSATIRFMTNGTEDFNIGSGYSGAGGLSDLQIYSTGTGSDVFRIEKANGNVHLGTVSGTQMYYCSPGVSAGNMCRGNGCSCAGGSWTATGVYLP